MTDLLLVDSNDVHRDNLADALRINGLTVDTSVDTSAKLHQSLTDFDVVVVSIECIGAGTIATPEFIRALKQVPVVLIADPGSIREAVAAIKLGAADYLPRPFEAAELIASVERALLEKRPSARTAVDSDELVGQSEVIKGIRKQIDKVGRTDTTVMIYGASGTGKELVARSLHANSPRNHAPLISINCAAVPEGMIEVELFGQENLQRNVQLGLLQTASGGTLFLDEIGELPLEAQARLLRVLAQGEMRAVGATATSHIDVRIIAATHHDLPQLVRAGRFREDLYYRLNVVSLQLPPLADRLEDIPILTERFLQRIGKRLDRTALTLAPEALEAMRGYHWPGNVRELENAIERAVILCEGPVIPTSLLAIDLSKPRPQNPPPAAAAELDQTSLEDYFVNFVLENQDQLTETELSQKLGISRKSLWERRQRLDIPRRKTRKRGTRSNTS